MTCTTSTAIWPHWVYTATDVNSALLQGPEKKNTNSLFVLITQIQIDANKFWQARIGDKQIAADKSVMEVFGVIKV